jgi:hypothetical protein
VDPSDFLGPFGLTLAALAVIGVLWRDHVRSDADDRSMRDRAMAIAEKLVLDAEGRRRANDP